MHFRNKVEIEQIRAIEESGKPVLARFDGQDCSNFDSWLRARTAALKEQQSIAAALAYPPHLYRRIVFSTGVLLGVLGIISTSSLLTQADNTLNIFWLLGALLGLNGLSLVLWCLFAVSAGRSNTGIIAPLLHRLMLWLAPSRGSSSHKAAASRAWFRAQLNPLFHQWYLGRLTHAAWACYLVGSILGLLLLFATRQFNFVWESTLLDAEAFVHLSQMLAAPLQWLGLATPNEADILHSGRGQATLYGSELRQQWALFLLASLALYGVLPRLIAAAVCWILERRGRQRWQLDLSQPYYRQLQQQYWPSASPGTIIDPDPASAAQAASATVVPERPVPTSAHWIGIELNPQLPWPGFTSPAYLGQVTDRESLTRLGSQITELEAPVAITVEAARAPDRGLQRNLRELLANCREPWLALLDNGEVSASKWQNWQAVAKAMGVNDQQITRVVLTS